MSEMQNGPEFDEVLARAMQRVDAPEGFAEKVVEATSVEAHVPKGEGHGAPGKLLVMPRVPVWISGAIAAMVMMGIFAGGALHLQHRREQAQATAEFAMSMQITNRALEQTRQQLQQAGISLGQQ